MLDAQIAHVTSAGAVDWRWKSQDHIALSESAPWGQSPGMLTAYHGQPAYDIVHLNSIELDGDGIVFSARHLDAVYRLRLADGSIDWKLGGTARPESLTIVDDPLGATSFGGQHDARMLADGTLTLHDNGTGRDRPPRALRYSLDTSARTATLLEQLTDSRVPGSGCCGSARRLTAATARGWGGAGVISELAPDGRPVLTLTIAAPVFSYRAVPWDGPAGGIGQLRRAMDAVADQGEAG